MIRSFFPYPSHLLFAHTLWKSHLSPGDSALDATCGNGYDTEVLSQCVLTNSAGRLFCFDRQTKALEATKKRLRTLFSNEKLDRVTLYQGCHSLFTGVLIPIQLIVYNLGYLPGADKACTTKTATTLASLKRGLELLKPGGALSIMCYPGHPEGKRETAAVCSFFDLVNPQEVDATCYTYPATKKAPLLIWAKKPPFLK